jgi:hypothetical protein
MEYDGKREEAEKGLERVREAFLVFAGEYRYTLTDFWYTLITLIKRMVMIRG